MDMPWGFDRTKKSDDIERMSRFWKIYSATSSLDWSLFDEKLLEKTQELHTIVEIEIQKLMREWISIPKE